MTNSLCNFVADGLVLREQEGVTLLDRKKLRERGLKGALLGKAREVCVGCLASVSCCNELEVVHDGIDWTVGLVPQQEG